MDDLTIRRLAVIKQLYLQGVQQSYEHEPLNGFSILSFHDSVEMFMSLCAEINNITVQRNTTFIGYFDLLKHMECRSSMENLNKKRVSLKHSGAIPSVLDIEVARVNVTDFFNRNTPLFFNVDFEDISLVSLVKDESVRHYIELAHEFINDGKFSDAIMNLHFAFNELIWCHMTEADGFYYPRFSSIESFTSCKSHHINLGAGRSFDNFVDKTIKSFENLDDAISIIGLGIDYRRYYKFNLLKPLYDVYYEDSRRKYRGLMPTDVICNLKNAKFCFNFVIDSALQLQRFELEISDFRK